MIKPQGCINDETSERGQILVEMNVGNGTRNQAGKD